MTGGIGIVQPRVMRIEEIETTRLKGGSTDAFIRPI